MKHYSIRVTGTVQGVFYRSHTHEKALELGLTGFVRNKSDGSVLIEVEGEEKQLKKLLDWCSSGSPVSSVDRVDVKKSELIGYDDFTVQYFHDSEKILH